MITYKKPTIFIIINIFFIVSLAKFIAVSPLFAAQHPMEVKIVTKEHANYDTPEDAFAAIYSAKINRDAAWYYEGLTQQSAEHQIELYKKYNIDIQDEFEIALKTKSIYILDKQPYHNGVFLLVKVIKDDGTIIQGPSVFVQENGFWKSMQQIPKDDPINAYLDYTPPPAFQTPFDMAIVPPHWSLTWFNWIEKHIDKRRAKKCAEKATVLCVLAPQNDENKLENILPETLRLNETVAPQPWSKKKTVLIIAPHKRSSEINSKKFRQWRKSYPSLADEEKALLLVRFNQYETMKTLADMLPDGAHEIVLSGRLANDKVFRAKAEITLVAQINPHGHDKKDDRDDEDDGDDKEFSCRHGLMESWWDHNEDD